MIAQMKFWVVLGLLTVSVSGLTACKTIGGAGEDIEEAGEAIEESADKHSPY